MALYDTLNDKHYISNKPSNSQTLNLTVIYEGNLSGNQSVEFAKDSHNTLPNLNNKNNSDIDISSSLSLVVI